MSRVRVITPNTDLPVTLEELKSHLRIYHTEQDAILETYLRSAAEHIQQKTGLVLLESTLETVVDSAYTLLIFRHPFVSLEELYYMVGAIKTIIPPQNYEIDDSDTPVTITLTTLPTQAKKLHVRFKAGYASPADIPADLKAAIMLLAGRLYISPDDPLTMGTSFSDHFLRNYKVRSWRSE